MTRWFRWPAVSPMTATAIKIVLSVVAVLIVFVWALKRSGVELGQREFLVALMVQPLNLLSLIFIGWRVAILAGAPVGILGGIKAATLSNTLLYVLPGRMSELVKPIYLADRYGIAPSKGLAALAVERFLDVIIVALAIALGVVLVAHPSLSTSLALWGPLALAGIAGCAVVLMRPGLFAGLIRLIPGERLRAAMTAFVLELQATMAPRRLFTALGLGLCAWSASYLMVYLLIRFNGSIALAPSAAFLVFLAGTAGLAVAVAPGGLGTFETGIVLALKIHGYGTGEALVLALLMRVSNLGFLPLIAAYVMFREGIGLSSIADKAKALLQSGRTPPQG